MNTVLRGDEFEDKAYELIVKAIEDEQLGIAPQYARVFRKKRYFSPLRNKDIVFDLSIEIWPPNAERYSVLYVIECKDYKNKNVPVDDIEEFIFKLSQISNQGHYIKACIVTNNALQESALEICKNARLMWMEVDKEDNLNIKLHRTERIQKVKSTREDEYDRSLEDFLYGVFNLKAIEGLKRLSKNEINKITTDILFDLEPALKYFSRQIPIDSIIEYFKSKFGIQFEFFKSLDSIFGKPMLGYYDIKENKVYVDISIYRTERFSFVLAHELGHATLHRDLKINQEVYDKFEDSEYDLLSDKYELNNHKHWIEWQANKFATYLLMPEKSFVTQLIAFQKSIGISNYGRIYLDNQPINRQDYSRTLFYLSEFFNTTRTSVIFRLEDLHRITYDKNHNALRTTAREMVLAWR